MFNQSIVTISLIVAVACLTRLASRGGSRNMLLGVAAFFFLFAYGPVINLMLGEKVYFGIHLAETDTAAIGFALAMIAMVVGDTLIPQRREFQPANLDRGTRTYVLLPYTYIALIIYGLVILSTRFAGLLGSNKLAQIALAGPGHRIYLLVELAAVSMYFLTRRTAMLRRLWLINLVVYLGYSLLTSERDFLLVLLSILIHREILANKRRTLRLVAVATGGVVAGSFLFASRASERLDLTGVLNQGSILFVDTFIAHWVPNGLPYRDGGTYVDTLVGILPTWAYDSGVVPLNQWLVSIYTPGGESGYGFSLTGEAYLNFGLLGIPIVFLICTLAHRLVVNRADVSDFWCYFSVYSAAVWMYALRGDSSQLLKSLVYGAVIFAILRVTSLKVRPATRKEGPAPSPEVRTPRQPM